MKQTFRFLIIGGMTVSFLLPLWGSFPDQPFHWADDEGFKPMIYRDSDGKSKGVFYDVLTEAFRRMKVPLQNRLYPWSRAQKMVREGKADGMITVFTKSRRRYLKATDPIIRVEERIFVNRNNPRYKEILKIRSIDELKNFTVVETLGSGWSKEELKGTEVIWVPTAESALNMIASGRADIYLMSNYTGPGFLKERIRKGGPLSDKLEEIHMGTYPFAKIEYRLLIRKDSPYLPLIDRFNKTLHEMKKDGTYRNIIKRYQITIK